MDLLKSNIIKYIFIAFVIGILIFAVYFLNKNKNEETENSHNNNVQYETTQMITNIRLGISDFDNINPIISQNREVINLSTLILEPLLTLNSNYRTQYCLAKEIAKSEATTYVVKLNENIHWSDGSTLTAKDVKFTVEKIKENKQSVYAENVARIKSIEIIDYTTLKIILDKEVPFFEYNLTFPIISYNQYNEKNLKDGIPLCTGMYKITSVNGDKIELVGNFKLAQERRNPGGFDYRFYLKTKKIYGIVTTKNTKKLKENNVNIISMIANKTANVIKNQSKKLLKNKEACLLIGLLIGDTDEIDEETKEDFRNSNLTHMLAVSGLHVSYVLLGVNYIITKVKIHKKLSKIIVMLLILFFILVTGATPSVLRAGTMTIYLIIGGIFYRRISVFSSLNLSLLVIIIMNPYCLLDVGLQLSYAGTIGIVYLYPIIKEKIYNKANSILITISANIVIIPIMLYNFNTISLTFFISNLLAGPIIGIIIILWFYIILIYLKIFTY